MKLSSRKLPVFVVLVIIFSGCAYYNTLFNAKRTYKEGLKALESNRRSSNRQLLPKAAKDNFEATIEKGWKLIEIYSDKSKYADDALLYIAKSEYYLRRYGEARLHLEQFQKKYPNSDLYPESNLWLGKVLQKFGDERKASEYLQNVILSKGHNELKAQAFFELGKNAYEKEDYPEAIRNFKKALKEKSNKEYGALLQFYLGESYFRQGQYKEAVEEYKKVQKYSPTIETEVAAQINLARATAAVGRKNDALLILRKMLTAVRFQKYEAQIKNNLAKIYVALGEPEEAEYLYKEVVLNPKNIPGKEVSALELARLYETTFGNIDSALVFYGAVRRINPRSDSIVVAEKRRKFLQELSDLRKAIRRDTRLVYRLKNDPDFRDSLYSAEKEDSLREVLRRRGKLPEQKEKEFQELLKKIAKEDSLEKVRQDSIRNVLLATGKSKQNQPTGAAGSNLFGVNKAESGLSTKTGVTKTQQLSYLVRKKTVQPYREKRKLARIEEDLKQNLFHQAEFFLLKAQQLDSAAYYYQKFANTYHDSLLTPKSLYSLIYIYSQPDYQDSLKVRQLRQQILTQYSHSIFAQKLLNKNVNDSGNRNNAVIADPAQKRFEAAESLFFANKINDALAGYESVAAEFKNSEWGAKAQFAIAWIYEHRLQNTQEAVANYQKLIENFSEFPQYVRIARLKTAKPVTGTRKTKGVNDNRLRLGKRGNLARAQNESGLGLKDDSFAAKKLWRMRRNRSSKIRKLGQ